MIRKTEIQETTDTVLEEKEARDLILWNDDVHTFDFVTETLIEVCKHDPIQAEQCTHLVHFKGKCAVKTGEMEKLMPYHKTLLGRGLTSSIE